MTAQATTGETITIAAIIGTIFGVVQLASLVFKRKGDVDPGIAEIRRELKTIKEEAKLAAEAVIVQRFSVMTELAQINQLAHETRVRVEGAFLAADSDRVHFNEATKELRGVVEEIRHKIWGDGVPGLIQDQHTSKMEIEHLEKDVNRLKNGKP